MCGVTAVISKQEQSIKNIVLKSIELIQNRGYDSYGIAYLYNNTNNYNILKYVANNNNTLDYIKNDIIETSEKHVVTAFAHTRWATHGPKTLNNCHPHVSYNKKITLVHNGIINNYNKLKNFLINKNYKFYSDTDTEVIANLIEYYLIDENLDIEIAIRSAIDNLEGTYALIIAYSEIIDNIYAVRHGSPLLIGETDDLIILTSETSGFAGYIYNYIAIDNNDIFKVTKTKFTSINNNNYVSNNIDSSILKDIAYNPYEHWLIKEIYEQEHTILSAFNNGGRIINNNIILGGLDRIKNIKHTTIDNILFIGCGTSYHASLVAKYYFNRTGINVIACDASEFTQYDIPENKNNKTSIAVFCSQSGETQDLYNKIGICKQANYVTIGVINQIDSLIARTVDSGIYLNAGREISVASTKSFTSMLVVLSLFKMWLFNNFDNNKIINSLRFLSPTVSNILWDITYMKNIDNIAQYIVDNKFKSIFILGKKKMFAIAKEASLKLKEVCYIHAEGFSSSSLKHGPFAMLDLTNLTILLIDYRDKTNYNSLKSTYHEIISRDTNILVITNNIEVKTDLTILDRNILVLPNLEYYNEILFVIALQHICYNTSIKLGINPDRPRNLAKVVTVE